MPEEKVESQEPKVEGEPKAKKQTKTKETSSGAKAMTKEDIIGVVKNMTVLELAELIKALEEEFGVSAASVAVAAVGGAPSAGGVAPEGGKSGITARLK